MGAYNSHHSPHLSVPHNFVFYQAISYFHSLQHYFDDCDGATGDDDDNDCEGAMGYDDNDYGNGATGYDHDDDCDSTMGDEDDDDCKGATGYDDDND